MVSRATAAGTGVAPSPPRTSAPGAAARRRAGPRVPRTGAAAGAYTVSRRSGTAAGATPGAPPGGPEPRVEPDRHRHGRHPARSPAAVVPAPA
ncbi:hypothetical protein [Streptomyces sp. NPDC018347]|uniref:hypothetical protein n=1 Tax=Streptomyces sp. NPDC018347 TaxID=3157193 RepID=UPI0033E18B56